MPTRNKHEALLAVFISKTATETLKDIQGVGVRGQGDKRARAIGGKWVQKNRS